MPVKFYNKIDDVPYLSEEEKKELKPVAEKFNFLVNDYYLGLINWNDPNDPIRRLVIPTADEINDDWPTDPSKESHYTIMKGVQHKYKSTCLFLVSSVCAGVCRYCFRKRIFFQGKDPEKLEDLEKALEYVREHKEITNVLLTGGDPLMLPTKDLRRVIEGLRQIEHVRTIRLGTRVPVYYPQRILEDDELVGMLSENSKLDKRIYIITHFMHPRELTDVARKAIDKVLKAGIIMANQTPLIAGINDNPETLRDLLNELAFAGVPPYYIFQCRPTVGNKTYSVPVERAYRIIEQAKSQVTGLAKRAKYAMSHATGKIEIIGLDDEYIYFKYHRAAHDEDSGKFVIAKRNPEGYWFDDFEVVKEIKLVDL